MKLVMIDLDDLAGTKTVISPETAAVLNRLRRKGNLIYFMSCMPGFYLRKNFSHYFNGMTACSGRLAFTCCEMLVNRPLEESFVRQMIRLKEQSDAGIALCDMRYVYYEGPEDGFAAFTAELTDRYVRYGIPEEGTFYGCAFYGKMPASVSVRRRGEFAWVLPDEEDHHSAARQTAEKLSLGIQDVVYIHGGSEDDPLAEKAGASLKMIRREDGSFQLPLQEMEKTGLI